jgi:hypothetical protein
MNPHQAHLAGSPRRHRRGDAPELEPRSAPEVHRRYGAAHVPTTGVCLRRIALAIALVLAVSIGFAIAFWSAPGAGVASAASQTFDQGTIGVHTSGNSVIVTWTDPAALNPPSVGGTAITYTVERRLGSGSWAALTSGDCSGTKLHDVTACADEPGASGSYGYRAVARYHSWTATSTEAGPVSFTLDATAPAVDAQQTPSPNGAGWSKDSPVAVTLSADDGSGSGVDDITFTTDGSDPTSSGTAQAYTTAVSIATTTDVKYFATDVAGNASAVETEPVKIDTAAPTNDITLSSVSGGAFKSGTTIYYRSSAAGSFTLTNTVTDGGASGAASSATAALSGTSTGWTHSPSAVSLPSGGPYVSSQFSWTTLTTSSPGETVTSADAAGNTDATALTFSADATEPAGGAVDASGPDGAYSASTAVDVTFTAGTDSGAGLAPTGAKLLRATASLAGGSCGTYGAYSQIGADDPVSPVADTVPSDSSCYTYMYLVADRVGNETAYTSLDMIVDAAGPSGGSADAVGLAGTGARYATSKTLSIALDKGLDAGSGPAPTGAQLRRSTATLSSAANADGVCGSYDASVQVGADDPASPAADTVPVGEACYRYEYVVLDAVGNSSTYVSPDIKIDTTAPAAPTLTFSGMSNSYSPGGGSTTVYYAAAAAAGSFTVTAASSDSNSGVFGYNMPALGTDWTNTPTGPGVQTYSWSAPGPTAPAGAQDTSAADNAGLTSGATAFTMVADDAAPSGGTVTYTDGDTTGPSLSVSFTTGTDAGSGLVATSGLLQRAEAPLVAGTCGTFGSFTTVTDGANPTSPVVDEDVTAGHCYQYHYLQSDNLGNQATYTSTAVAQLSS